MTINQGIQYIKNPYVFLSNDNSVDNLDNQNYLNEISHSVKPIDKKLANIEAEQHEVLFEDGKLYNILGKPHSKGGTPLNASEGSFIFSKFTPLAINKKDKKLFELNAIKSDKNKNNSPAQILKKEIDIKHHNKMFRVLEDDKQDDISKKSAELMLAKNLEVVGKIGYLQEEKKNFPTGIPSFSDNTTPIVNQDLENKIMQSKQFMRLGGMRKFADGGDPNAPCEYGKNADGSCVTYAQMTAAQQLSVRQNSPQVTQFSPNYKPVANDNGVQVGEYLTPPTGNQLNGPQDPNWANTYKNLTPQRRAVVDAQVRAKREGNGQYQTINGPYTPLFDFSKSPAPVYPTNNTAPSPAVTSTPKVAAPNNLNDLTPGDGMNYSANPFNSNAQLSGYQNANSAYLTGQALNLQKYVPMRPQVDSTVPFVETQDYQPTLSQIDNSVAQQYDAGRFASGPQQQSLDSSVAGRALQAKSQAIGQINSQNIGIRNQQRQMASQILNGDNRYNIEQNFDYYNKSQMANSNYGTLKSSGIAAAVGDYNTNLSMLDKFKQLEASQKMGQQYIRNDKQEIEVKNPQGNSKFYDDKAFQDNKQNFIKNGWTVQTRQVPLFSTDRFGRVVNNKIDVNPLGMAGKDPNLEMSFEQYRAMTEDQRRIYDKYAESRSKGTKTQQQGQQVTKYGGKINKRYTVKNPF